MADITPVESGNPQDTYIKLSPSREKSFDYTRKILSSAFSRHPNDFRGFIRNTLNEEFKLDGNKRFLREDVSSLRLVEASFVQASYLCGQDIVRPVLIIDDHDNYVKFSEKTGMNKIEGTWGYYLKPSTDKLSLLNPVGSAIRKSGISVAETENPDVLVHEIMHTIDENKRDGFDGLLSEAFAYSSASTNVQTLTGVLEGYFEEFRKEEMVIDRKKIIAGIPVEPRYRTWNKDMPWFKDRVWGVANRLHKRVNEIGKKNAQVELSRCVRLEDYVDW